MMLFTVRTWQRQNLRIIHNYKMPLLPTKQVINKIIIKQQQNCTSK